MRKRIIALFCSLLICAAFLPVGAKAASGIAVQDLYEYDRTAMIYKEVSTLNGNPCRRFSGKKEAVDIVLQYINDIAANDPDLKVTTVYDKSYKGGIRFYSVSLVYTGKEKVSNSIAQNFMDNPTKGAVSMYFQLDKGNLSGMVVIDKGLYFSDLGYRSDGSKADLPPDVQEALKDSQVMKLLDSLELNQAYILRDGKASTSAEISFQYNQDSQLDEFRIYY